MSFNHVKEVIEIENTCLKEFRDEMAKMRDNAKDEFSREIFNDWVKYFDATIKLHKKAITNEARLRDGLKKENPALQRASDAIDSLGQLEKNPDIKDHYECEGTQANDPAAALPALRPPWEIREPRPSRGGRWHPDRGGSRYRRDIIGAW